MSVSHGFETISPQSPSLPMNDDGCNAGKIVPVDGIGPVSMLYDTLKLSIVLQFWKFEGIVPVREL